MAESIESSIVVSDQEWEDYKKQFKKNYDENEDKERRLIYIETKKTIEAHNKKFETGEVSWSMGINQFADKKPDETCGCQGVKRPPRKSDCNK